MRHTGGLSRARPKRAVVVSIQGSHFLRRARPRPIIDRGGVTALRGAPRLPLRYRTTLPAHNATQKGHPTRPGNPVPVYHLLDLSNIRLDADPRAGGMGEWQHAGWVRHAAPPP
ncbi:MAG: hypothetical protein OHK0015_21070 [Chloroflexi bacterium OHK40]